MTADDLRREIAASRLAIRQDYAALRAELDFVAKTKRAVVESPARWLGGAALVGYLFSGRRRAKAAKRKGKNGEISEPTKKLTILGVLFTAARLLFPLARPALTTFATRKLAGYASSRFQP